MTEQQAHAILQAGADTGADLTEIFIEETRDSTITFRDQKIESAVSGLDYGIGLRLVYGTDILYTHTSNDDIEHLIRLIRNLASTRFGKTSARTVILPDVKNPGWRESAVRPGSQTIKAEFLRRADRIARSLSNRVVQVSAQILETNSLITLINSEGLYHTEERRRLRTHVSVTAEHLSERFVATEGPGYQGGLEVLERIDIEAVTRAAAERALLMLDAGYISGGNIPVVMGNGFGGVIFHEACGHPLETEAIRRTASPFTDKIGQQVAHESVTAIDDGTVDNAWGSIVRDDEGTLAQKTILIENGILKNYLSDRVGSKETGAPLSGSARRQSYRYAPVARMRNTYIAAGKHKFHDMIASVDYGLYAKKMGGGSVNPATGEFNFAVEEGYVIRNGVIAEPVRGASLIGRGHETLMRISMVSDDLELAAGTCGAASGYIPVTVGQPSLKVDSILVGGR